MVTAYAARAARSGSCSGFTLVELLAAITIVGMILAASVPATVRFYESMQYRQAIRDVVTTLAAARLQAVSTGRAQDVALNPETKVLRLNNDTLQLPENFSILMHSAREVNRAAEGVIRFYPEGGSSGGEIEIAQPNGSGAKISVDWLAGRATQKKHVFH